MQFADGYDGSISLTEEYSTMLSIRTGIVSDVVLLRTLIKEFATFKRLPVVITEEQLRQDGLGAQPKSRMLIAECDGQPRAFPHVLHFKCVPNFGEGQGNQTFQGKDFHSGKNPSLPELPCVNG
jgi:hypothetical protein